MKPETNFLPIQLQTLLAVVVFALSSCIVPFSQKISVQESITAASSGLRITHIVNGDPLILSMIPVGPTPDIKEILTLTAVEYNCKELKNIELEYYNLSFFIFSLPRFIVQADCVPKSG